MQEITNFPEIVTFVVYYLLVGVLYTSLSEYIVCKYSTESLDSQSTSLLGRVISSVFWVIGFLTVTISVGMNLYSFWKQKKKKQDKLK